MKFPRQRPIRIRKPPNRLEVGFRLRKGYKISRGTFPKLFKIKVFDSQTVNGQVYCCHCCKPIPLLKGNIHIDHLYAWKYTSKLGLHYWKKQYLMASCAHCNTSRGSGGRNLSRKPTMNHLPPCTPPKETLKRFLAEVIGVHDPPELDELDETKVDTDIPLHDIVRRVKRRKLQF